MPYSDVFQKYRSIETRSHAGFGRLLKCLSSGALVTEEATFQFLAVRITDVTKLPKATSRAPSINFQEIP